MAADPAAGARSRGARSLGATRPRRQVSGRALATEVADARGIVRAADIVASVTPVRAAAQGAIIRGSSSTGSRKVPVHRPPCQMLKTATPVSPYQLSRMLRESAPDVEKDLAETRQGGSVDSTTWRLW